VLVFDDISWLYNPAPDDDGNPRAIRALEKEELVAGFGWRVKVEDPRRYMDWRPNRCFAKEFYGGLRGCCYSQRPAR